MKIDDIAPGSAIEVEVRCNGKTVTFKSDVTNNINNSILITPIIVNEQTIGFSEDCQIFFLYKADGKLYIWENAIVKLVKYNGDVYHKIDIQGEGKIYNRRSAYRMYVGEDMPLYVNSASGPAALSVLVKDISETGVGFIIKDDLEINRTVRLKLQDGSSVINLSGVIVRKEFLDHLGAFLYGCKFNEKNPHLGKYIARKQGELLRKNSPMNTSAPTNGKNTKTKLPEMIENK